MKRYRALAPAKVNLGLFLGPPRARDGRHELVTVMQSITLSDELELELAPDGLVADEVLCPGLAGTGGENLAAAALRVFRDSTAWQGPPVRLRIRKRIPVAAGLGGGSADAAAALRLARLASGLGDERLLIELAAELGADVPAQVSPGRWLATGAGERLQRLADPDPPLALLVQPLDAQLSTPAVYAQADRLELARSHDALEDRRLALAAALDTGSPAPADRALLRNDLERAAMSLCPQIAEALELMHEAGCPQAFVSGSGPTVVGLLDSADGLERARRVAERMPAALPAPIGASSVGPSFARAAAVDRPS